MHGTVDQIPNRQVHPPVIPQNGQIERSPKQVSLQLNFTNLHRRKGVSDRLKNGNERGTEFFEISSCQSVPVNGHASGATDHELIRAGHSPTIDYEFGPAIFDSADVAEHPAYVTTVIRHPRAADTLTSELRQADVIAEYGKFAPKLDYEWFLILRLIADGANLNRFTDSLA